MNDRVSCLNEGRRDAVVEEVDGGGQTRGYLCLCLSTTPRQLPSPRIATRIYTVALEPRAINEFQRGWAALTGGP
jgi:hypothetical protein